jgi:very-short-patch-repair endonuclease
MTTIAIISAACIVLLFLSLSAVVAKRPVARKAGGTIVAKPPLTANEQPMYFRLTQALPDHVILAQVAFSALLSTKDQATRNTFNRKVADFVVCTRAFEVVALVELDDSSHAGRKRQDDSRDALLKGAGYRVLRYARVPDVATVQKDVLPGEVAASPVGSAIAA